MSWQGSQGHRNIQGYLDSTIVINLTTRRHISVGRLHQARGYFGIGVLRSSPFVVGGFAGREAGFLNSVEKEVEDENEEEEVEVEMEEEEERGHWVPVSFNLLTPRSSFGAVVANAKFLC